MARQKRAYSDEEKQQREQKIIESAQDLLFEKGFHNINMSEVARKAGLAKGTVYLYFDTKEALFLSVFEGQLRDWFEDVSGQLQGMEQADVKTIVQLIVESIVSRPFLRRLAGLSGLIFEQNIPGDIVQKHKLWLFEQVMIAGQLFEQLLGLQSGQGTSLIMRMYVMIIGLDSVTDTGDSTYHQSDPDKPIPHLDFREELTTLLRIVIEDLQRNAT